MKGIATGASPGDEARNDRSVLNSQASHEGCSVSPHAMLASASIGIQFCSFRLKEQIRHFSQHRAALLSEPIVDVSALTRSEREFVQVMRAHRELLISDSELRRDLMAATKLESREAIQGYEHREEAARMIARQLEAHRIAIDLKAALGWTRSNYQTVSNILGPLSRHERKQVAEAFKERYGETLNRTIIKTFKGRGGVIRSIANPLNILAAFEARYGLEAGLLETLERAISSTKLSSIRSAKNGDRIREASNSIYLALGSFSFNRWEALYKVLKPLSRRQIDSVKEDFNQRHGRKVKGGSLENAIAGKLKNDQLAHIKALLNGEFSSSETYLCKIFLQRRKNHFDLCELIASKKDFERNYLLKSFETEYGQSFLECAAAQLRPHKLRFIAGLLKNEEHKLDVLRIKKALHDKDPRALEAIFYRGDQKHDIELIEAFNRTTGGNFWREARQIFTLDDYKILATYVQSGALSDADKLRHCLTGWGVDTAGIIEVLRDKNQEQFKRIAKDYSERFDKKDWLLYVRAPHRLLIDLSAALRQTMGAADMPFLEKPLHVFRNFLCMNRVSRNLENDVKFKISGYSLFDVMTLPRGEPGSPEEMISRLRERFKQDSSGLLSGFIEKHSSTGQLLIRDFNRAISYWEERKHRELSAAEKRELRLLVEKTTLSSNAFRSTKLTLSNISANLAAGAGVAIAYYTAFGTSISLAYVMLACGTAAFAARVTKKTFIHGKGYGRHEVMLDGALSAVDGACMLLSRVGSHFVMRASLKGASAALMKQGIGASYSKYLGKRSVHAIRSDEFSFRLRIAQKELDKWNQNLWRKILRE